MEIHSGNNTIRDSSQIVVVPNALEEADFSPTVEKIVLLGSKKYNTSWGTGMRLAIFGWLVILVLPFFLTTLSIDSAEVPSSMTGVFIGVFLALCVYLVLAIFLAPSCVTRESALALSIRVSPCNVLVSRINLMDVERVERVSFRELMRMRFTGFPTDWKRSVAIRMKSGRTVVVSLKDPDEFVSEVSCSLS